MKKVMITDYDSYVNCAVSLNMTISSTCFEHKNIHKVTWVSPDGKYFNQTDHILIDARHGRDIMHCRSHRGANIDSDHYLVLGIIRARISTPKYQNQNRRRATKYSTHTLGDPATLQNYSGRLSEILSSTTGHEESTSDVDDESIRIKEAIKRTAEEALGIEGARPKNELFDCECQEGARRKNEAYRRMQTRRTRTTRVDYQMKRIEEKCIQKAKKGILE
jgi:hypothetical protein